MRFEPSRYSLSARSSSCMSILPWRTASARVPFMRSACPALSPLCLAQPFGWGWVRASWSSWATRDDARASALWGAAHDASATESSRCRWSDRSACIPHPCAILRGPH
eukprot:scaffold228767_cov31-Tisochrysis_lutea.AAC.3